MRSSPRDALLAVSAGVDKRGLAFGLHRAMDNAGAVVGPLVASLLLAAGMSLKDIFLWSIVPALLCLGLSLALREPDNGGPPPARQLSFSLTDMPPVFKRYLVIVAIFTLGNSSNMFLLLRARELGVAQAQIPLLWATVSLVAMLFSTPLSALSDKWGRARLLLVGYLAYGLFYFLMGGIARDGMLLFLLFASYGIFMAATEGVEKALVADLAPDGLQGKAFGWFNLTAGVMLLPASVVFGWLYQHFSPQVAFGFSGGCAVAAALLLVVWMKPGRRV